MYFMKKKKILVFPQRETPLNSYLGNLTGVVSDEYNVVGVNFAQPVPAEYGSIVL